MIMNVISSFCSTMAACFTKAQIVVDKFHVGKLFNWALENIRKKYNFFYNRRQKYFNSHLLLLKRNQNLTYDEQCQLSLCPINCDLLMT